jgi:hypothetical protein
MIIVIGLVVNEIPIQIRNLIHVGDLIVLPMKNFDCILGMDCLSRHNAWVNCKEKKISL